METRAPSATSTSSSNSCSMGMRIRWRGPVTPASRRRLRLRTRLSPRAAHPSSRKIRPTSGWPQSPLVTPHTRTPAAAQRRTTTATLDRILSRYTLNSG